MNAIQPTEPMKRQDTAPIQPALQVRGLTKYFGGVHALDGISFEVLAGQCVALIGPNGAGKSTCFACLAGQHTPTAGQVVWQGQSLLGQKPAARQQGGVARTFQVAQTFEALTVLQNIQLVLRDAAPLSWWDRLDQRETARAGQLAEQVGLQSLAQVTAANLPYGAKKRLELAMALAGLSASGPSLLLLDEPAAGLAQSERADMMALVRQVAAQGVTVLYTEHNMDAVFGVADRVLVLMQGRLVADGLPEQVAQDPLVLQNYLGMDFKTHCAGSENTELESGLPGVQSLQLGAHDEQITVDAKLAVTPPHSRVRMNEDRLEVSQLNAWYGQAQALFDVSFQVNPGEMLVLQGLNGAGKSSLLQALIGVGPRVTGRVDWSSQRMAGWPAHQRAQAGLGFVAEDRRLFTGLSVRENLWIAARGPSRAVMQQQFERVLTLFPVLGQMLSRPASQMSGGEQQMLAIARTLMTRPRLLLLDEPCEGIAPVLVQALRQALLQLRHEGMSLLVAEQNNILAVHADRVLLMVSGRLEASLTLSPKTGPEMPGDKLP
jgi:ABC-type branched-subunit amino acid transport system ATPase component